MQKTQFKQIPFRFQLDEDVSFDNFFVSPKNELVVRSLKQQMQAVGEPIIYLWGEPGAGCSHLLQAASHAALQRGSSAFYLPLVDIVDFAPEDILEQLDCQDLVCIDGIDVVAGRSDWEQSLFHFYNRLYDSGNKLIVSAHTSPSESLIQLPDLKSRLAWGITYYLHALTDEELIEALKLRGAERGLVVSDEVGSYIINRSARSIRHLFELLERLDKAAMVEKRKLTVPFVKKTLNW